MTRSRERTIGIVVFAILVVVVLAGAASYSFKRQAGALRLTPAAANTPDTVKVSFDKLMAAHVLREPQATVAAAASSIGVAHPPTTTPAPAAVATVPPPSAVRPASTSTSTEKVEADEAVLPIPWPAPRVLEFPLSAEAAAIPITPITQTLGEVSVNCIVVGGTSIEACALDVVWHRNHSRSATGFDRSEGLAARVPRLHARRQRLVYTARRAADRQSVAARRAGSGGVHQ
jgi:hypothetical protein